METSYLCMNCMCEKGISSVCIHCGFDEESYVEHPSHLKLRSVLNDRYLIGKTLGHGGFGITYIAYDQKLNIPMAIKEFLPSSLASRTSNESEVTTLSYQDDSLFNHHLDRFLDEARTLAQFSNEAGIVSIQDYFRENGTVYIAMFYVNGITLESYLEGKGGKISFDHSLKFLSIVMNSMSKVHNKGIIHRDISPDNIYITKDQKVKLLDFGAARYVLGDDTKSLSVILKRGYAPLEQYFSKGKQGPWTDVYAIAATLYRCITGIKPPESTERSLDDEIKRPSELGVDIPSIAEAALMKALSVRHENRYPNMTAFLDALNGVESEDEAETVMLNSEETVMLTSDDTVFLDTNSESPIVDSPKKEKKKSILPFALILLIILGSASYMFLNKDKSKTPVNVATTGDKETATTPVEETKTPPAEETETPPVEETETPPVEETETPPAEETKIPPAEETKIPPAEETETPPAEETETPPAEETKTPPVEETKTPPVEETKPKLIKVPNLVGMNRSDAESKLTKLGLTFSIKESVFSEYVLEDVIISHSSSSEEVEAGTNITFTLSKGSKFTTVPSVMNLDLDSALNKLKDSGLNYEINEMYSRTHLNNHIIVQEPFYGIKAQKGDSVMLYINRVPLSSTIPSLMNLRKDVAIDRLKTNNINYEIIGVTSYFIQEGNVVSQDPPYGLPFDKDTKVVLYVSIDPETNPDASKDIPSLMNMRKDDAIKKIESFNINYEILNVSSEVIKEGHVVAQDPAYGLPFDKDTKVIIYISTGPKK